LLLFSLDGTYHVCCSVIIVCKFLHKRKKMAVPLSPVDSCRDVEIALSTCEGQLLTVRTEGYTIRSTSVPIVDRLVGSGTVNNDEVPGLIACGLLLSVLTLLHIARQAWYAWGGEDAFAFPFDK
jgi:hypothetical protein